MTLFPSQGALWDALSSGKLHTEWKLPASYQELAAAGDATAAVGPVQDAAAALIIQMSPQSSVDSQPHGGVEMLADVGGVEPARVWATYEGCIPLGQRPWYPFILWDAWACLETLKEVTR